MADRTQRITRRTLLQATGLAPFVALAASGASDAELAEAARPFTNLQDPASDVLGKAKEHAPNLDVRLFNQVVWVLWLNFVAGTKSNQAGIADETAIIKQAYIMPTNDSPSRESGDKIVDNLDQWKEFGKVASETNWCAYRVGLNAAGLANGAPITVDHFRTAWLGVAKDVKSKFSRLNDVKNAATKDCDDEPLRFSGAGC